MLVEVTGLFVGSEVFHQDNHSLKVELVKFYRREYELPRDHTSVARTSLPASWGEVVMVIMQYITLENFDSQVCSFHFTFLNHLHGWKMNILNFFNAKLDKAV